VTSQLPPAPGGDEFGTAAPHAGDSSASPDDLPRDGLLPDGLPRNGLPTAAMVLGVVSVGTLLLVPLVAAICSVLAIVFGIIGLRQVRTGRSNRRGFALTGLATGIAGLVILVVLVGYAIRRFDACQRHVGHQPNTQELLQCRKDRI
jgi:hypothetical protein